METDGERHSLLLHHLKITDFGNYSCLADNGLGSSKASILVSGRPEVVRVTSPHLSLSATEYSLTWQTVSLLAILDNSIKYRLYEQNRKGTVKRSNWTNIIPPLSRNERLRYDGVIFKQTFPFYGLQPDSKYEVRVRAKNEEGWSEPGKSFIFTTPRFDRHVASFGSTSTRQIRSESLIVMFAIISGALLF